MTRREGMYEETTFGKRRTLHTKTDCSQGRPAIVDTVRTHVKRLPGITHRMEDEWRTNEWRKRKQL